MNNNKSGSLFKRNLNISEEFGIVKKSMLPNSVTYTESELAEEKRKMARRATPNCTTCPDCPPDDIDPDNGGSGEVPPNQGLPGTLPSQLFQSVVGYSSNGNPLSYVFPENGKDAWDTLYEYMFATNKGRTDFIFIGEDSIVYENDSESGDMVGGFADGFAKGLLELTDRELYATPVYYGYETVKPSTYDSFDTETWNDGNPTGYGKVLVGTRNLYDSVNNPDGSIGIATFNFKNQDILQLNSPNTRFNGIPFFFSNLDPNFYTKSNQSNTFQTYEGGPPDDYYRIVWNPQTTQCELANPSVIPYNDPSLDRLYFGKRPIPFLTILNPQSGGINGLGCDHSGVDSNGDYVISQPQTQNERILSYFTVDSVFNRQTMTTMPPHELKKVVVGKVSNNQDGTYSVDYFFYEAMKNGLVPPYLGKWYSPNRQSENWTEGDDYEVDSTKQKIKIEPDNIITDPNDGISIDIQNTNLIYLNDYYPFDSTITNDIVKLQIIQKDNINYLSIDYDCSYFFKIRTESFNWSSFTSMPGFDESTITASRPESWDIVDLDTAGELIDGKYPSNTQVLLQRYNETNIQTSDMVEGNFSVGMPDAYQLNDIIHGTGWCSIAWPASFSRRVGTSIPLLNESQSRSVYRDELLGFTSENSVGIKPYQQGLTTSSAFRISQAGVLGGAPHTFTASISNGACLPFGTSYTQQEFQKKFFYASTYWNRFSDHRSFEHDKSRRVKCFMKTGLYMTLNDVYYTKQTKEPIYTSNNFKYLVNYIKLPLYKIPDATINETFRDSNIALSITPERNDGTLGTSFSTIATQSADDTNIKIGFASLSANLSALSSDYTKLNLSFLGYNTNNNTEGDIVIPVHSGIDCNNSNGVSFSVLSNESGLRYADIEYSWRSSGWGTTVFEMFRHIKERQTKSEYGGTNTNTKIVVVWLLGRQETGNGFSGGIPLYGGLQGQNYMQSTHQVLMSQLISLGFAPSDILFLFVCHPKAAAYSKQTDETGRIIQDPRAYTNLYQSAGYSTPIDNLTGVVKSIFYATNENQNPTLGILKNSRKLRTAQEQVNYLNTFRVQNPDTEEYSDDTSTHPVIDVLVNPACAIISYAPNILYFDTPSVQGAVNINNRLNDSHYSVEYDMNGIPVVSYKYLNERGYLQFGKDFINILKNGL